MPDDTEMTETPPAEGATEMPDELKAVAAELLAMGCTKFEMAEGDDGGVAVKATIDGAEQSFAVTADALDAFAEGEPEGDAAAPAEDA